MATMAKSMITAMLPESLVPMPTLSRLHWLPLTALPRSFSAKVVRVTTVGHGAVHLAGQFDEAGRHADLAGFPSQVVGVDRDAMAAKSGAGIKGLIAERLGFSGIDDLENVDAHAIA